MNYNVQNQQEYTRDQMLNAARNLGAGVNVAPAPVPEIIMVVKELQERAQRLEEVVTALQVKITPILSQPKEPVQKGKDSSNYGCQLASELGNTAEHLWYIEETIKRLHQQVEL